MSAIVGIYYPHGQPVSRADLSRMNKTLSHRGTDGSGEWIDGAVGLAHQMLWTTPESLLEKLPFSNAAGDRTITADARIDNRDELIPLLGLGDRPPDKITDSQIILAAYERWGEACPEYLLGDFAFAIWDEQTRTLFCARDHFGVRPFYYYHSDELFTFATEIKALFCLPNVPRQLNEVRIADYLKAMFHDTAMTSYQHVLRLPPAHSMTISPAGASLHAYWSLDPTREVRFGSNEEYAAEFRKIFTEAVRCRLRTAFPIGCMLSGGLDSSSITCIARNLLAQRGKQQLHTFSAVFDTLPECDERAYIEPVLAQGGLEPHYVKADQLNPLHDIERMFWHQDEAFNAPNEFMSWALYGATQQQGVRVLLSGFDGDTTVSEGYGYLSELARAGRWLTLAIEIKEIAKTIKVSAWQWLWSYVNYFGLKPTFSRYRLYRRAERGLRRLFQRHHHTTPQRSLYKDIVDADFAQHIGLDERCETWQNLQGSLGQTERERHYRSIATQGLPPFALEVLNKATAAFGIEPRYPFWDKRLVEFCLALPAEQKLYRGWNRIILRRAMTSILPKTVQWRRGKADFFTNFANGLLREQPRLEELMLNDLGVLEGYINSGALQQVYQRFLSQPLKEEARGDAYTLWAVVSLGLWLRYATQQSPLCREEVKPAK